MSLILAIEPDRHQAGKLRTLVEDLGIDLAIGVTAADALAVLGDRIPDLVLTSSRLKSAEDSALAARVRELDAAGAYTETLVVPDLCTADGEPTSADGPGRRRRAAAAGPGNNLSAFATLIVAALERGAAARVALAAAQAELEAAWAQPAASGAAIDVHPGMVIDNPEALFGEFAAIPIRAVEPRVDPVQDLLADAPLADDGRIDETGHSEWPSPAARFDPSPEEEWEEIALDAFDAASNPAQDSERGVGTHDVEVADGGVDLDAFVAELKTAPSTANAQPIIPVIDLSHLEAAAIDLPVPVPVAEEELRQEECARVAAEIRATFADTDGSLDVGASLNDADTSGVERTPSSESLTAAPLDDTAQPHDGSAEHSSPRQTQESWRARLDLLPPPVERQPVTLPAAPTSMPAVRPPWGDLLSAIRRDIGTARTDETSPIAASAPKTAAAVPLVFPSRSAATARVLAAIESGTAERRRPDSPVEPRVESAAPLPDAALAELLRSVQSEALAAHRAAPSAPGASGISPVSVVTAPPEPSHPDGTDPAVPDLEAADLDGRELREERTTAAEANALASADAIVPDDSVATAEAVVTPEAIVPSDVVLTPDGALAPEAVVAPDAAVATDPVVATEEVQADTATARLIGGTNSSVDHREPVAIDLHTATSLAATSLTADSHPPPRSTNSRKRQPARATVSASETTDGSAALPAKTPETPEWGFLDAQADGFTSLLARLNAATADRSWQLHR